MASPSGCFSKIFVKSKWATSLIFGLFNGRRLSVESSSSAILFSPLSFPSRLLCVSISLSNSSKVLIVVAPS